MQPPKVEGPFRSMFRLWTSHDEVFSRYFKEFRFDSYNIRALQWRKTQHKQPRFENRTAVLNLFQNDSEMLDDLICSDEAHFHFHDEVSKPTFSKRKSARALSADFAQPEANYLACSGIVLDNWVLFL